MSSRRLAQPAQLNRGALGCSSMPVLTDVYVLDALDRLRRDLRTTGHGDRVDFVGERAADVATFENKPVRFVEKVIEDVQQRLQDEFIDTTWPACPRHPNHPLTFVDGGWRCPQDGVTLAPLGELQPN